MGICTKKVYYQCHKLFMDGKSYFMKQIFWVQDRSTIIRSILPFCILNSERVFLDGTGTKIIRLLLQGGGEGEGIKETGDGGH
jgi:hypothetical protein